MIIKLVINDNKIIAISLVNIGEVAIGAVMLIIINLVINDNKIIAISLVNIGVVAIGAVILI